jgi:DNA gyrase/topoisomerase IV subunit A
MDELIPNLYRNYGIYVNRSRAFPLDLDGFKPVERRILLAAYQIAKDKLVKSARVDAHALGHWHPHSSAYGTIVQLYHQKFLDGQGNFGNDIGVEESPPAAMRYTECKLSKNMYNLAFRLIDYVPWSESELDDEPEYLPTMYPGCLLGKEYTVGIGFGYKTLIPCYSIEDLKKRLSFLLGKTKENPIIRPISDCKFFSTDKEFELLLTKGKSAITAQGIFKVDNIRCKAIVKSWPHGKRFDSILSKFEKELGNQDIGYIDESSKENGGTHIVFEVLKTRNRSEIFQTFVSKLKDVLSGSIPFEIIVVEKQTGIPKLMSVDKMLIETYNMYKETTDTMLKSEELRYRNLINENKLLQKIKIPLAKNLQSNEKDMEKIIDSISTDTGIDKNIVKNLIQKYKISKLLSVKDELDDLEEKIKNIRLCLNNLDAFVLKQYESLLFTEGENK